MRNLSGFRATLIVREKLYESLFLAIPIHIELLFFYIFLNDIFYKMIIVQFAAVSWILSHSIWFSWKGCLICNENVPMGISKQITGTFGNMYQQQLCLTSS